MPRHSVRDVIVETALGEFHRIGYAACSVDTITRAAGVPKGSFYNHFKSKEELAVEVVAKYTAEAEWNGVTDPELTPLQKLRAQVRASLGGWAEGIGATLRAARDAGELTIDADPDLLGRFVLDAWEGALLRSKVVKNDQPIDDFFTTVFTHLLH